MKVTDPLKRLGCFFLVIAFKDRTAGYNKAENSLPVLLPQRFPKKHDIYHLKSLINRP
jgi:hypothetical protein